MSNIIFLLIKSNVNLKKINDIFHQRRDISLRNVNMDELGYVKLLDFGFSICPTDVLYGPRMSVINNKLVDFEDYGRCVWEMLTKEVGCYINYI